MTSNYGDAVNDVPFERFAELGLLPDSKDLHGAYSLQRVEYVPETHSLAFFMEDYRDFGPVIVTKPLGDIELHDLVD